MRNLKILFSYLGAYRRDAMLGVLFVTAETALELFIPVIMANIIDVGVPAGDINYMLLQGTYMLICAAFSLVLGLGYARTSARVASGLGANLREAEYRKIQTLAFGNLDNYDASSLVTRMTTDITVIQNAIGNGFRPMVRGPVTLIVGLVYALVLSRPLATVFAIILPVLAIVLGVITYRVSPLYRQLQTSMDHLNGVVQEDLTAVRAVKAYVRAEHEEAKFDAANTELAHTATKTFGNAVLNLPVFQLSMYVAALSILWIGGRMILAGELGVGSLTGFMSYVLLIMNSLMMISNVFLLLTRALASVERISRVLDERSLIQAPDAAAAVHEVADGSIEFRDVSFKYRADAAEDVLEHIDLCIEAGSTVGVLGGTGSGKSSLVQLIARLYDATEGTVLVGGHDVRDYDLATLRDAVGIVLQKNVLFTGTVRENLQWGNPQASDDELLAACRAACVDEFLDRTGGLDGELGQGAPVFRAARSNACALRARCSSIRACSFLMTQPARSIWRPTLRFASTSLGFPIRPCSSSPSASRASWMPIALWCWTTVVSTAWARTRNCWRATTSTRRFMPRRWSLRGMRTSQTAQMPRLRLAPADHFKPRKGVSAMPKTSAQARPANLAQTLRRLLSYMGHAKFSLLAVGVLASVAAIASLAGTYMVRPIVNGLATGGEELLAKQVIFTAAIYAAGVLPALGYSQIMVRAAQRVVSDIRRDLFAHIQMLPLSYFDSTRSGDIMSFFTNDVDTVSEALNNSFANVIQAAIQVVGTTAMLIILNWQLTIITLVCDAAIVLYARYSGARSKRFFAAQQASLGDLDGYIEEMVSGQKVIKVFNHEQANVAGFDVRNQELRRTGTAAVSYANSMVPMTVVIGYVNYAIVAVAGGMLCIKGLAT